MTCFSWPGSKILYLGDDDKDEEAFKVVLAQGCIPFLASEDDRLTLATKRLPDPPAVRGWLETIVVRLENHEASRSSTPLVPAAS